MIQLPENIDYTKYYGKSGMSTRNWGGQLWESMFISIMGRYPVKITTNEDIEIKDTFKNLLTNLKVTIPCIFCRQSFEKFLKELPIEQYLIGRIELMYWLYLMKDKVNKKLIKQEEKCYYDNLELYNNKKNQLKKTYYNNRITKREYKHLKIKLQKKYYKKMNDSFYTIPSPPFEEILDYYEKNRAICSKKSLSCVLPNRKK